MKTVAMVDYIGYSDSKGEPLGHPLKVFEEFRNYIKNDVDVAIAAPRGYLQKIECTTKYALPCFVDATKSDKNLWENGKIGIKSIINIWYALRKVQEPVVWFYNVDQFLFTYIALLGIRKKQVIVTLFHKSYERKIYNVLMKKALRKVAVLVVTNEQNKALHQNRIYIPDYVYDEEEYKEYQSKKKEEKIVLVGTLNKSKRIKEVVEVFENQKYILDIHGKFYDDNVYHEVSRIKGKMTKICNEYLTYDEYKAELGQAKYCILPYDMKEYKDKTSGVMLEAMFMHTIPIAPKQLLDEMGVPGIGYRSLEELEKFDFLDINTENLYEKYDCLIEAKYKKDNYIKKLVERINAL